MNGQLGKERAEFERQEAYLRTITAQKEEIIHLRTALTEQAQLHAKVAHALIEVGEENGKLRAEVERLTSNYERSNEDYLRLYAEVQRLRGALITGNNLASSVRAYARSSRLPDAARTALWEMVEGNLATYFETKQELQATESETK